jgi:hypothetical protein
MPGLKVLSGKPREKKRKKGLSKDQPWLAACFLLIVQELPFWGFSMSSSSG